MLTPKSVSVPVPTSVRPPVPETTPANVVELLLPPAVSVAEPRAMALVVLALAIEPTVLLKPFRARVPLLLRLTALRPVAPPNASVEPAVRVPLLTDVAPEYVFVPESVVTTDPFCVTPPAPVMDLLMVTAEFSSRSSVPLFVMPLVEAMVPLAVPFPSCRFAPLLIVVAPV